jgi:hypothetical protein
MMNTMKPCKMENNWVDLAKEYPPELEIVQAMWDTVEMPAFWWSYTCFHTGERLKEWAANLLPDYWADNYPEPIRWKRIAEEGQITNLPATLRPDRASQPQSLLDCE